MNKRGIALLSILFLFISLPAIPANAAAKAGGACSKAGITSISSGRTFTCIKSGKKLVWNKGVKVSSLMSNSSPVTFKQKIGKGLCDLGDAKTKNGNGKSTYIAPSKSYTTLWDKYKFTKPTSTEAFKDKIESSFKDYISVSKNSPANSVFYIQPGLLTREESETFEKQFKMYVNLLTAAMPRKPFAKPISMVAFRDSAWALRLLKSQECSQESIDGFLSSVNAGGWAVTQNSTFYLKVDFAENGKVKPEFESFLTNLVTIPHEIYHLVQFRNLNQLRNEPTIPNWFTEGSANFLASLVTAYKYPEALSWGKYVLSFEDENLRGFFKKLSDDLDNIKKWDANYHLGQSACEFLTYLVGYDKLDAIWIEMGKNKRFSVAFQDSTGIELVDFYKMFAEIRPVLGIPKR